jgi:glycosyltransferase involved in cell wall biosynthesis
MKIVILNDHANVQGGAAQVAVMSAIALAEDGNEVLFIHGTGESDKKLSDAGVKCISLNQYDLLSNPSRLNATVSGLWNYEVENKLTQILREHKSNSQNTVVHIHSWVKCLSISAVASVFKSGLPHVFTLHDYFSVCPNGGLYNYQTQRTCQLKPMSVSCMMSNCDARSYSQKLWRFLRQILYKFAYFPDKGINFISVSDFSENLLREYLPLNSKFYRVANPIDISKMPQARPSDSDMFTYIGRLAPEKGVEVLLGLENIPQEKLRLVGTGELEPYLKKKLPRAHFEGWCEKPQITTFLDDSRALIFPSLLYETQGLVVLEAAARGVPAVVSSITAASEFIDDGKTGLLFDSDSADDLEKKLMSLINNQSLADSLGNLAYANYWNSPTDVNFHAESLIKVYSDIVNN